MRINYLDWLFEVFRSVSFLLELDGRLSILLSVRGCFWYLDPDELLKLEDKDAEEPDLFEAFFELLEDAIENWGPDDLWLTIWLTEKNVSAPGGGAKGDWSDIAWYPGCICWCIVSGCIENMFWFIALVIEDGICDEGGGIVL